jgi:hypothetical protein
MTFDLRQDGIFGIEEAMRTAGILRAALAETQNAISIVFPNQGLEMITSGHVTRILGKFYVFFIAFLVCHVILKV